MSKTLGLHPDERIMAQAEVYDTFGDSSLDDEGSDYDSDSSDYSSRSGTAEANTATDHIGTSDLLSKTETVEPATLDLNCEGIKHIASLYLPGEHGNCTDIIALTKGALYESHVLHFEDGWSCIGRFTTEYEHLIKLKSKLAAMERVSTHTSVSVPEIYFDDFNANNVVGAVFLLMERSRGGHLDEIGYDVSAELKKVVLDSDEGVENEDKIG